MDAAPRGGPPGTLYVIEPERDDQPEPAEATFIEAHGMDPVKVLRLAAAMGAPARRLLRGRLRAGAGPSRRTTCRWA